MRLHPAAKVVSRMLRRLGVNYFGETALGFRVVGADWRPCFVDLKLSVHENRGRIEVSGLYDHVDAYASVAPLHGVEFTWKD
jgi:hypothetical protein